MPNQHIGYKLPDGNPDFRRHLPIEVHRGGVQKQGNLYIFHSRRRGSLKTYPRPYPNIKPFSPNVRFFSSNLPTRYSSTESERKYIIKLRCTEEEKAKTKVIAKSCEMDVSELLRELVNKHLDGIKIPTLRPVRRKYQFGRLYKAYRKLNRIGVNINQIARGINIMAKGGRAHESFPEILCKIMSTNNRLDVILDVALEEDGK